jgi:starvation-inducible DNA-binding protein
MSHHHAHPDHALIDEGSLDDLVDMLNQSLADTLDLAYQTKQAHWNVKGPNFYSLHLLFDSLYGQLSAYVDAFAERAVTLGGHAYGTIRVAASSTGLEEYPLDAKKGSSHVDALVDRYGAYTSRLRHALRQSEKHGDRDSADLYIKATSAMDKAIWMLTSHQED